MNDTINPKPRPIGRPPDPTAKHRKRRCELNLSHAEFDIVIRRYGGITAAVRAWMDRDATDDEAEAERELNFAECHFAKFCKRLREGDGDAPAEIEEGIT